MTFTDLGIDENIIQSLLENRITHPSDIQIQTIPLILRQQTDIVAVAQTGTGKTAAFCLPILQTIDSKIPVIQALILVPTRELGQQVAREFFLFSKHLSRVFAEAVYGGAPIEEQIQKLKRPTHVVVATPGRLLDLLDRNALSLGNLKYLVLDEADEMINMGFRSEIDQILSSCNKGITQMLFTATLPHDVKQLIHEYLRPNFVEINVKAEEFINQNIEHQYIVCKEGSKMDYLKAFLHQHKNERGIVFCRTKTDAKRIAKQLAGFSVIADALHGNLNQEMRDKVMRGFRKNRINVLVATDIAARGIDVKDLDYIIHFHLPEKTEQYTHRSGRTARAGKSGISICLVKTEELNNLKTIENELNIEFNSMEIEAIKPVTNGKLVKVEMNMGIAQNFTKTNIVDFLVEEGGLNPSDIKNVSVTANRSSFLVMEDLEKQIFINLKGFKIFHRNLKLERIEIND